MSRKLAVVFFAMFVLASAMGLKTVLAGHNGAVIMANGTSPKPPTPMALENGTSPKPPTPMANAL